MSRIDYSQCDTPELVRYVNMLKGEMREINDYNLLEEVSNRLAEADQKYDLGYNRGYSDGHGDSHYCYNN